MNELSQAAYRQQITQLVRAMSLPDRQDGTQYDLSAESMSLHVKMFVDDNVQKRFDKLQSQLAFIAEAFDDFDKLMEDYVSECPQVAYDCVASDGDRLLNWLGQRFALSAAQQDYVVCQEARHAVEKMARSNRLKYVRFQELYSLVDNSKSNLVPITQSTVYLNPIRTWRRFTTGTLLDEQAQPPADVLFFAVGGEVSTALLELEGQALINELADFGPCTIGQWAALSSQTDHEGLTAFCQDLAEMGLVAFG